MKKYVKIKLFTMLLYFFIIVPLPESIKIAGVFMSATIFFGIAHDQITARRSPEIFTKSPNHAAQFPFMSTVTNPTVLGLFWGSVYSPFFGAALSIPVIACARIGSKPRVDAQDILFPIFGAFFGILAPLCVYTGYRAPHDPKERMRHEKEFSDLGIEDRSKLVPFTQCNASHEAIYYYGKRIIPPLLCGYTLYKRFTKDL